MFGLPKRARTLQRTQRRRREITDLKVRWTSRTSRRSIDHEVVVELVLDRGAVNRRLRFGKVGGSRIEGAVDYQTPHEL